jgi:hypothetical protein
MISTFKEILCAFQNYFTTKYDIIPIHQECFNRIMSLTTARLLEATNIAFETPITPGEMHYAIKQGKKNNAPGFDGICQGFFHSFWEVTKTELLQIKNDINMNHDRQDQQKHGLLVCLPKHKQAIRMNEYRPLTFLNTDIKLLARIIAKRLKPWMPDLLSPNQHCCVAGTTVFDALATIRDAVAFAEVTHKPMCRVSLDFQGAFRSV